MVRCGDMVCFAEMGAFSMARIACPRQSRPGSALAQTRSRRKDERHNSPPPRPSRPQRVSILSHVYLFPEEQTRKLGAPADPRGFSAGLSWWLFRGSLSLCTDV